MKSGLSLCAGVVSETTNGLAGTVVDGEGKAAAARVAWRPADFLPGEGSAPRHAVVPGARDTLASLPDVFTSSHALEKLRLDRNRLTTLPASLLLLGGLQVLHLGGNRLCDIPAETGSFIEALPEKDHWKGSQTGC